jgi:hypothetical protein
MNRLPFVLLLVAYACIALAQQQPDQLVSRSVFGIQDATMIDAFMPLMPGFGGSAREMLQQQSVKPFLMPVRNAGTNGDETAYQITAALEYYINRDKNFKINLSPDFISLQLRKKGQYTIKDALSFLNANGTVSAAVVAYDASEISEAAFYVPSFKIANYLHIFREISPPRYSIFEVKKALLRGNPVIVELAVSSGFRQSVGTRFIEPGPDQGTVTMMVIGFDETAGAFELQACRGHEWGINGYAWIKFDDFDKCARNGFVLVPQ